MRSKGNGVNNLSTQGERELDRVIVKQRLLISGQIFEQAGIEGIKKDKMCRLLRKLGSVKRSPK